MVVGGGNPKPKALGRAAQSILGGFLIQSTTLDARELLVGLLGGDAPGHATAAHTACDGQHRLGRVVDDVVKFRHRTHFRGIPQTHPPPSVSGRVASPQVAETASHRLRWSSRWAATPGHTRTDGGVSLRHEVKGRVTGWNGGGHRQMQRPARHRLHLLRSNQRAPLSPSSLLLTLSFVAEARLTQSEQG